MRLSNDVNVSVNWDDLLGRLKPNSTRDPNLTPRKPKPVTPRPKTPIQPRGNTILDSTSESEESPIRFAPSNATNLRTDSDHSPRRRSYKSNARLLESDSDEQRNDARLNLLQQRRSGGRGGKGGGGRTRPGESAKMAAARLRRERRRPWEHPDPEYFDLDRVAQRDRVREQLMKERDESGSEASLPSTTWGSAEEGPSDPLVGATQPGVNRKPFNVDELDQMMQRTDRFECWKDDTSMSEGEVAPLNAPVQRGDEMAAAWNPYGGGAPVVYEDDSDNALPAGAGYLSDGEVGGASEQWVGQAPTQLYSSGGGGYAAGPSSPGQL